MDFISLTEKAKKHFPDLKVKYKNESYFMKFIGKLLFFNKAFMENYTTTIGSTIYFPSKEFVDKNPIEAKAIFLHELVHVYDAKKINKYLFGFLYLFPQILFLLAIPMMFFNMWFALPFLLFLLPLPAYFRMIFEKRAYKVSLYSAYHINRKYRHSFNLTHCKDFYLNQFKNSSYYFMWVFPLKVEFNKALMDVVTNRKPFNDDVFVIIDDLLKDI